MSIISGQAIDPMYLILSGKAYLIWIEKKHPHVPKVNEVREAFQSMTAEERKAALSRARTMIEVGKVLEEAVAK